MKIEFDTTSITALPKVVKRETLVCVGTIAYIHQSRKGLTKRVRKDIRSNIKFQEKLTKDIKLAEKTKKEKQGEQQ